MADPHARDLVVVAASAGGVEALRDLLARLPADLAASVLIVLHVPARGSGALAGILDRAGPLEAAVATDGERLRHGRVYVAPPDHHLLVQAEAVRLSRGPRHNGHRPAADPLFLSAALYGGPRTLSVVLSGTLDDGARGCAAVERHGGLVAVQDPEESAFDGMPRAAIAASVSPEVLTLKQIAEWIVLRGQGRTGEASMRDPEVEREVSLFLNQGRIEAPEGTLSGFSCPECGGPIYETQTRSDPRYECRVGHGWSAESMVVSQSEAVERALWVAILRLEERLRLLERMIRKAREQNRKYSFQRMVEEAEQTGQALETMRMLQSRISLADPGVFFP
ncbi:chemotaxis protein CheB [Sphaerisporangium corydalis]|uniref:protein-glutamate methylesterase n=1 Tax=Sphaerisporangium corydalis TaxID=1441875 RepID=A0ABV9ET57_9ACTN|nr:chemotaxis protein CheB [Sphaerisporangium corydalis]